MKTFKIFSTAALALMMAACSSEDAALNNSPAQQQGRKVHFTATIAAPGGNAGTRTEYTEVTEGEAAGTINVAWKAKDEIALIHNGTKDVVTVETVNEDGSATITGDITVGTDGEAVIAYYPAAAIELNNDKNPVSAAAYTEKMLAQDGTLSYIASNLDLRVGKSTLAVDGDKATLSDNVKLTSQIAIWKLSLLDGESNVLQATQVKIKGGTSVLASTATIAATSEVTLAIPTDVAIDGALTIEATVGSDTYAYTKEEGVTFYSKYYQSKVTMAPAATDLSKLTGDYTAKNGETLTGTLKENVKISIADGATVTLDNVSINADGTWNRDNWAGLTCEGDATIILKEGTTNTVKGFYEDYPGILAAVGHTLIITGGTAGTGSLDASSNGKGAGIGGGQLKNCGNIEIQGGVITAIGGGGGAGIGGAGNFYCGTITISGGTITANGGDKGAGIGSGSYGTCGNISISGGTVTATGGANAAGIGSGGGSSGTCGDIEITTDVTKVTATKGSDSPNSIGAGNSGTCGTVTIAGTVYWDGENYKNGGATYLTQSTIVYPSPFANVTASDLGKVIGADGKIYADATAAKEASTTAVAVICYVGDAGTADASSATYKGLALALEDANSGNQVAWCSQSSATCLAAQYDDVDAAKGDMAGIANTDALVGHATHTTHAAASAARGYNSGTHPTGTSAWFLPSAGQWEKMIDDAAGNYSTLITRASLKSDDNYWSSSELSSFFAWRYDGIYGSGWGQDAKDISRYVRACLAF